MKQSDRRNESRRKIIEAAREVFFREDFLSANLDEVAQIAGLSKGSIYRYFANKAGLYLYVVGEAGREYTQALREVVEKERDAHVMIRLRSMARFQLDYWTAHPDHLRIFWAMDNEVVIGELPSDLVDQVAETWRHNLSLGQSILDDGVARGELRPVDTWNLIHSFWILQTALIEQDTTPVRRRVRDRTLEQAYFDGLDCLVRGALAPGARIPEACQLAAARA